MSAESLINAALLAAGGVTAIVGAGAAARIYPDFQAEGGTLPAVVYQRSGTDYLYTIHSRIPTESTVTIDCHCLAATRLAAEQLADAVVAAIAAGDFMVVDRRQDFDPDVVTFDAIVSAKVDV